MPLQDEMTFQRIEMLLDIRFKKLSEEIKSLKDELAAARDDVRKVQNAVNERPSPQAQWQEPAPQQQWQPQAPQQGYPPQQQGYPPQQYAQQQAPTNRYAGQFDAPASQAPPQQAPPAAARNKWAPPPEKPASTEPIDRNGVAPAEAEKLFQNFFYMGGKKK